jgi:hypothetical protein
MALLCNNPAPTRYGSRPSLFIGARKHYFQDTAAERVFDQRKDAGAINGCGKAAVPYPLLG